ncbi:GNAT family N-acetyltransferase [Paenibacillus sp. NPDC058071]|uniref:GNAT family N-acetyltransferase n=1 Tax=Paenibacillus sp. NPDC058071 TaxID=3346326 RepID=UPI0036D9B442
MDVIIRELMAEDKDNWRDLDDSFTVDSTLVLSLTGRQVEFTVKKIPSYTKSYSQDQLNEEADRDNSDYIHNPDRIVYLALVENHVAGRILLNRNWNKYAYVEDITVDKKFRGLGLGRKLMDKAVRWAQEGDMPGIMLETQSNNVSACQFYSSCGFTIGGFDHHLYQGIHKNSDEIAIFWYLIFE